jgi:thiamine biosynthesis lipoprotein
MSRIWLSQKKSLDSALGGMAKGWAVERAARWLARVGPALVDAGGDIAVSGPRVAGEGWAIAVADPFAPECELALLTLLSGVIATSGRDYRRWQQAGTWHHHIVDPRTGRPARTDVVTATVVAPTAWQAEAAAKAALILGGRDGLAWIDRHPPLGVLLTIEDGSVLRNRLLDAYLWR